MNIQIDLTFRIRIDGERSLPSLSLLYSLHSTPLLCVLCFPLISPHSEIICHGFVEPSVVADASSDAFQFERVGYFVKDKHDYSREKPVFNRTIPLRESAAKRTL